MTSKPELCDLIATNPEQYNPCIIAIWSYEQDDGFGNMLDTLPLCVLDPERTAYISNFFGRDSLGYPYIPCQYGDH